MNLVLSSDLTDVLPFCRILCLLGGYILIGSIYRYYFLGIHSVEVKQSFLNLVFLQ